MASFVLTRPDRFPDGTSVGVYRASDWLPGRDRSGAPPGSAVTTATVSGGSVSFSGLSEGVSYVAGADVGGSWRYVSFMVPSASSVESGVPAEAQFERIMNAFDPLSEYLVGDVVVHEGQLYRVIEAHTTGDPPPVFDPAKFEAIDPALPGRVIIRQDEVSVSEPTLVVFGSINILDHEDPGAKAFNIWFPAGPGNGTCLSMRASTDGSGHSGVEVAPPGTGEWWGDNDVGTGEEYAFSARGPATGARTFRVRTNGRAEFSPDADVAAVTVQQNSSAAQTLPLLRFTTANASPDAATLLGGVKAAGHFFTAVHAAPADADLAAGELAWWFDQTNGAAKLMLKGKQADGTVRTGQVALA